MHGIGVTLVTAKRTPENQQVERSLVPMALPSAALDPVKPQVLHPRFALPNLLRCQTSHNSLIYGTNFRNYVRVTDSGLEGLLSLAAFIAFVPFIGPVPFILLHTSLQNSQD